MRTKKVLLLATSRKTRGGVTAVVMEHMRCPFWRKYEIRWIETHIDQGYAMKLWYAFKGLLMYLCCVRNYDLVHIHTSELPSVRRKYLFFKIAKALGKKVVVHLHIGNQLDDKADNPYYQRMFQGADAIIVLSESIRIKLRDNFGIEQNVYVIKNPCPRIFPVYYTDEKREILYAGTLNRNKGYSILIRAFSQIASRYPDWRLVIAGNGELREARALVTRLGLDDQVSFPGWLRGRDKDDLFRQASVFCLASYAEGFPMAVLDAWAYGLPVVATPVGGLPDVLEDGHDVLFSSPGDVNALAGNLSQVLSNPVLRRRLSEASLRQSGGEFSRECINEQISSLYEMLLERKE